MSGKLTSSTDPRIVGIRDSNRIVFWSIKHQRLIDVTKETFNKDECEMCIPSYNPSKSQMQPCRYKFKTFTRFKNHLLAVEERFKRELVWTKESEIPSNPMREREIGYLITLEDEPILKINFDTVTLVNYQYRLREYFKNNGCPCKDSIGQRCPVDIGYSKSSLFTHLKHLEREKRTLLVFKGTEAELPTGDLETKSNDNSYRSLNQSTTADQSANDATSLPNVIQSTIPTISSLSSKSPLTAAKRTIENKTSLSTSTSSLDDLLVTVSGPPPRRKLKNDSNDTGNTTLSSLNLNFNHAQMNESTEQRLKRKRSNVRPIRKRLCKGVANDQRLDSSNPVEDRIGSDLIVDDNFSLDGLNQFRDLGDVSQELGGTSSNGELEFLFDDGVKVVETVNQLRS